jgi:hypothetical protein
MFTKNKQHYLDILETLGHEGESLAAVSIALDINRDTLWEWENKFPEFSEALTKVKRRSQMHWEGIAKQQATEGKGNAASLIWMMKNMFRDDYQDRIEHDVKANITYHEVDFQGYDPSRHGRDEDETEGQDA